MATDERTAIDLEGVQVAFDGRSVLNRFDLQVAEAEKVTLTGPSGCGKSTVLKCILGFVAPEEGSVRVQGQRLDGQSVWGIRQKLAYVAQEPDLGTGTARQAVERPFSYKANLALRGNLERFPKLMDQFNLPRVLLDKEVSTLSGGEKQRIALLSALLLERPILLLDEAASALDKTNRKVMGDILRQAKGLTVLSVAHDTEWLDLSDRVVTMTASRDQKGDL